MKKQFLLTMIKIILFLFFLSTCWMIYTTSLNMREGFTPAQCSELGDCGACAGVKTTEDGVCAWDSKIGSCRKPTSTDDATYVSTSSLCSARKTNTTVGESLPDAIWTNPKLGCPVCPALYEDKGGSKLTAQK